MNAAEPPNPEQLDDDNPEWTGEDIAKARRASDVLPELAREAEERRC